MHTNGIYIAKDERPRKGPDRHKDWWVFGMYLDDAMARTEVDAWQSVLPIPPRRPCPRAGAKAPRRSPSCGRAPRGCLYKSGAARAIIVSGDNRTSHYNESDAMKAYCVGPQATSFVASEKRGTL